jgi:hypothetical protein
MITPKRLWIEEYLNGLARSQYTGRVVLTLEYNKGGITRLTTMREDAVPN